MFPPGSRQVMAIVIGVVPGDQLFPAGQTDYWDPHARLCRPRLSAQSIIPSENWVLNTEEEKRRSGYCEEEAARPGF